MNDQPFLPHELRYDYAGCCWWCGSVANSREHKFKRSDLVRMFGAGPYRGDVAWGRGEERRNPQGASSSDLKFAVNLCRRCNNERSQPFDRAYDMWAEWVTDHLDAVTERDELDLTEVFDADAEARIANLARYFVKAIGCRIAAEGVEVPEDFIAFLDGGQSRPSSLRAGLGIRLDLLEFNNQLKAEGIYETPGLFMRPLAGWYSPSAGAVVEVWSGHSIGPLEFWYWLRLLDSAELDFAECLETGAIPLHRYYEYGPVNQASSVYTPGA